MSKKESAPISDAMKKGEEPLRSFGDLLQFYSKEDEPKKTSQPEAEQAADTIASANAIESESPQETSPQAESIEETPPPPSSPSPVDEQLHPDANNTDDDQPAELPTSPDKSAS